MLSENKQKDLEYVKQKVGQYLPLLLDFLDNNQTMLDYSKNLYDWKAPKIHIERQKDCLFFVKKKIESLFPKEIVEKMDFNFSDGIVSNVVEHHNILNHPILISGLVISNLYYLLTNQEKTLLVLTCGGVPFNNFFNKKGFTFKEQVFPFVTNRDMHKIIHNFPKKELNFLEEPRAKQVWGNFNDKEKDFLKEYQSALTRVDISNCQNFVDEITKINYSIFKLMFEEKLRRRIPHLIDFELEYLAAKMVEKLCKEKNSFIYKTLFDRDFREIVLKEFEGIWGAWNKEKNLGTHFFWLNTENGEQKSLVCEGNCLKVKDADIKFEIELKEEIIIDLLKKNILSANIFLFFGITIFYCGIKPLTGLGSINYLSDMQSAWVRALASTLPEEADLVKKMNMKSLICSPVVTYSRNEKGEIISQFFADIVSRGGLTTEYLENLSKMKFGEIMKTSLIENYEVKTPPEEKKPLDLVANDLISENFSWIK